MQDFKKLFLELTQYTVPFGTEDKFVVPIIKREIPGIKMDSFGNLFIKIGKSRTLFTAHMDTYSKYVEKVNHVVEGDIIKTDGTTILGGDNKNGVLILMHMIKQEVPGLYYFFVGEEGIVTGSSCNGSNFLLAHAEKNGMLKEYDRAIAFDRRGTTDIVTRQRANNCCSVIFQQALSMEFAKSGLIMHPQNAYGTDTAVFMEEISEITNISSGGSYEHTFKETTNISFVEQMAVAATIVDWENLPTKRMTIYDRKFNFLPENIKEITVETTSKLTNLLSVLGFRPINTSNAEIGVSCWYQQMTENGELEFTILKDKIYITTNKFFFSSLREHGYYGHDLIELAKDKKIASIKYVDAIVREAINSSDKDNKLLINELDTICDKYITASGPVSKEWILNHLRRSTTYNKFIEIDEFFIKFNNLVLQNRSLNREKKN